MTLANPKKHIDFPIGCLVYLYGTVSGVLTPLGDPLMAAVFWPLCDQSIGLIQHGFSFFLIFICENSFVFF